jgi:hypothetical protein
VLTLAPMAKKEEKLEERLAIRLSAEQLRDLDALRRDEPGLPGRAAMFRLLLARAVEAAKTKKKPS